MNYNLQLKDLDSFNGHSGPLVLIIMDGIGIGNNSERNAIKAANTRYLDEIRKKSRESNLYVELYAHGTHVGLPSDDLMGNSEVGHNAIGAGRIVKQRSTLTKEYIESGDMFETQKWKDLIAPIKKRDKFLHYIGLLSDGYVHSHISHLFGLIDGSKHSEVEKVRIHVLLDGRDVPPQSALKFINKLEKKLGSINENDDYDYAIASGGGRMRVTMDRYNSDWDVVRRGWEAHVCGIPEKSDHYEGFFSSAESAIKNARKNNPKISDQYLPSFVVVDEHKNPKGKMDEGDGVIFFNFRGDRAIEISRAFDETNFSEFERKCNPDVNYYGIMLYDDKLNIPRHYFLEPPTIKDTLTSYLCTEKIRQFSIAETHKFGHIKYFFLGNRDQSPCPDLDEYKEIKSDPSEMVEANPEMKAEKVKNELLNALENKHYDFLRVNFANGDMVGHTGNFDSAKKAAKIVNDCVKDIVEKIEELNGITIITADHGNLEDMSNYETSHTLNPVMFSIIDSQYDNEYEINTGIEEPGLGNIAATILNLLGYEKPENFLPSLIKFF